MQLQVRLWLRNGAGPVGGNDCAEPVELDHHLSAPVGRVAGAEPGQPSAGTIQGKVIQVEIENHKNMFEYEECFPSIQICIL